MVIINIAKGAQEINKANITRKEKMTEAVNNLCNSLLQSSDRFDRKKFCADLSKYLVEYHRVLCAPISNKIYLLSESKAKDSDAKIGDMATNIEAAIEYVQNNSELPNKELLLDSVYKMWDHITLAQQQYNVLKQSDAEYKRIFDEQITPFKENLLKETSSQMLVMVSIFTALAFLIFGSISSLDNIFENVEMPLFKVMMLGSVWSLGVINLIFVFLFCVAKMTKLNWGTIDKSGDSVFQKYSIVCLSNFVLAAIYLLSLWGYYITSNKLYIWLNNWGLAHPECFTIVSFLVLISILGMAFVGLIRIVSPRK